MKVLFLTGVLKHYRTPVLDRLGNQEGIELTVAHSGHQMKRSELSFFEVILKERKIAVFSIHDRNLFSFCQNFDVVIAMFYLQKLSFVNLAFRKKRKFQLIFWGHGIGKSWLANLLRKRISRSVDAFITYDLAGKENVIGLGVDPSKVFIANNTINVPNLVDTSEHPKDCFLYVGRLQKRKELGLFLHEFKRLESTISEHIKFILLGDGLKEKLRLQHITNRLGLDGRVEFINGSTDNEKLLSYFSRAYAYVSLGHVGLGVLHSFAYGVPVITLKDRKHAPEFSNIVHNKNGIIIDNESSISAALLGILEGELYKKLGKNAFEFYRDNRRTSHMVDGILEAVNFVLK